MTRNSFLTLAASLSTFAATVVEAQQPIGGPLIHNGYVLSVPAPAPVSAPVPAYVPTSGVAPATGFAPNQYGPAIPVTPQQPAMVQQYGQSGGAPHNPQWNYGPQNGGQFGAGQMSPPSYQGTAIYYGSSQYRREQDQQRSTMNRRGTDPRQPQSPSDTQRPRFSTDPQPVDPNRQQQQGGVIVDPLTGSITRTPAVTQSTTRNQPQPASDARRADQQKTQQAQQWEAQMAQELQQRTAASRFPLRKIDRLNADDEQSQLRQLASGLHDFRGNEIHSMRPGIDLSEPAPTRTEQLHNREAIRGMNFNGQSGLDLSQGALNDSMPFATNQGAAPSRPSRPMGQSGPTNMQRGPGYVPQNVARTNGPAPKQFAVGKPANGVDPRSRSTTTAVLK